MTDPTTGLPALPKGQSWRVVEKTVEKLSGTKKAKYEIQLLKLQADTKKTKVRYEPYHPAINWFMMIVDGRGRAVPYTLSVPNGPLVLGRREIDTVDSNERSTLSPSAIKFAAEELLRDRAHRKYVDSLLGDYPPKTIVNDSED